MVGLRQNKEQFVNENNRREAVVYRGRSVRGLYRRHRAGGTVYEARVRVNGELRRQTFDQAKTTAEAVQALDAFKTALRNGHRRPSRGGTASPWPMRTPSTSSGSGRTAALRRRSPTPRSDGGTSATCTTGRSPRSHAATRLT
jgi:hypothetical protein